MAEMSEACFAEATRVHGDAVLVGVPNAGSTPGYTGRLGFRLVRPLPVVVCPPVWPLRAAVGSVVASAEWRESAAFDRLAARLDLTPTDGFSHRWTRELLRWRLGAPGAAYAVHVGSRVALVTCATRHRGVPITVVLKAFRLGTGPKVAANDVIAAACRHHGTPFAIYGGFSATIRVVGVPVPARFKPSPLNLIVRSLRPGFLDAAAFVFDSFELLDFDAF
jgi:hypothetical protein